MKINWSLLAKQASVKVIVVAALFLVSLFVFAWLARVAVSGNEYALDRQVGAFVAPYRTATLISAMEDVTFLGSSTFLLPAYVALVAYFAGRKKLQRATDIAIIGVSSTALMFGLKQLFHRHRPQLPIIKGITTYSFPSGHALSSFIFCSVLIYLVWDARLHPALKYVLIVLLLAACLAIGFSRIVLNVHYATDVIAGFCLGIMWVILCFYLFRKLRVSRFRSAADPG